MWFCQSISLSHVTPIYRAVKISGRLLVTREPRGLPFPMLRQRQRVALALPVFVRRFLLFHPRSTRILDSHDWQGNLSHSRPAEAH